ncbi:MAG: hypothetical protein J5449_13255, partial [Oscillospiraceae bacterium]|nr:hypothetical protein [Oscillospiraceae bacterium]
TRAREEDYPGATPGWAVVTDNGRDKCTLQIPVIGSAAQKRILDAANALLKTKLVDHKMPDWGGFIELVNTELEPIAGSEALNPDEYETDKKRDAVFAPINDKIINSPDNVSEADAKLSAAQEGQLLKAVADAADTGTGMNPTALLAGTEALVVQVWEWSMSEEDKSEPVKFNVAIEEIGKKFNKKGEITTAGDTEYTLTVNYLIPVGPVSGNVQVASKTEKHKANETYSVQSPNYDVLGFRAVPAVVEGTMPAANKTVNVVYSKLYMASVEYKLPSDATKPGNFRQYAVQENLLDGAEYKFTSPTYEGLAADRKEVKGNIAGANANEIVTYKVNDFTVTVYHRADASLSEGMRTSFFDQAEGFTHHGYKDGEFYSVPSPSYYGVRPLQDKVEGTIECADVEATVYYTDTCTNPNGHNWVVTHNGQTHMEKCLYCQIEKAPRTAEITYESIGENQHSVRCGICGGELRTENCTASSYDSGAGGNLCSGRCANCHETFDYGNEHDFSGQKWAPLDSNHHGKVCSRCGHVEREQCNANSWTHKGSGTGAQHATACSACGQQVGAWQNCSYHAERLSGGRHTFRCQCGRTNGTANCHFELQSTTASGHTYKCSECNTVITGSHNRCIRKENEIPATSTSTASYTRVTYCGRCGYVMETTHVGGNAKKLPVKKLTKPKTKNHFIVGGGGGVRRGGGGGGQSQQSEPLVERLDHITQSAQWIDVRAAAITSEALAAYLYENFDTLLLPAEDALEAYFEATGNYGEGWSVELQPVITLSLTDYDEASKTLTVDISATYDVYVSNEEGVDALIGQNYPLTVNFPVDLTFDVPAGIAANGETLNVLHTHNNTGYKYTATVATADNGAMATATFTSTQGLSVFVLSTTRTLVTGSPSGNKLTYTVKNAPANAMLIAARYNAKGMLTSVQTITLSEGDAKGTLTMSGSGTDYRLMLVNKKTYAPLCAAWKG